MLEELLFTVFLKQSPQHMPDNIRPKMHTYSSKESEKKNTKNKNLQ